MYVLSFVVYFSVFQYFYILIYFGFTGPMGGLMGPTGPLSMGSKGPRFIKKHKVWGVRVLTFIFLICAFVGGSEFSCTRVFMYFLFFVCFTNSCEFYLLFVNLLGFLMF